MMNSDWKQRHFAKPPVFTEAQRKWIDDAKRLMVDAKQAFPGAHKELVVAIRNQLLRIGVGRDELLENQQIVT